MDSMHNIVSSKHAIGFYPCKTFFKANMLLLFSYCIYKGLGLKIENLVENLRNLGINVPSGNLPSYVRWNWSSHELVRCSPYHSWFYKQRTANENVACIRNIAISQNAPK